MEHAPNHSNARGSRYGRSPGENGRWTTRLESLRRPSVFGSIGQQYLPERECEYVLCRYRGHVDGGDLSGVFTFLFDDDVSGHRRRRRHDKPNRITRVRVESRGKRNANLRARGKKTNASNETGT